MVKEQINYLINEFCGFYKFQRPILVFHNDAFVRPKYAAHATEKNGISIIGITATVALVLRRYFMVALAHRSEDSKESKPPFVKDLKSLYSYPGVALPINREQSIRAEELARIGLTYVAAHELSHLKLGHVAYIPTETYEDSQEETKSSLDYLAMELQADRCAADILMSYALMLEKHFSIDLMKFLSVWLAGIGSTFRMEWDSKDWSQNLFDSKHPPAQYRGIAAATQLLLRFKEKRNSSDRQVVEIFEFMTNEVERFHKDVTGSEERKLQGEQFGEFLSKHEEYTSRLLEHHKRLFPEAKCQS